MGRVLMESLEFDLEEAFDRLLEPYTKRGTNYSYLTNAGYVDGSGKIHSVWFEEIGLQGTRLVIKNVLRALLVLHKSYTHEYEQKEVMSHRDVKPSNVLISADPSAVVKLTDFNLAARRKTGTEIFGVKDYKPPEYHWTTKYDPVKQRHLEYTLDPVDPEGKRRIDHSVKDFSKADIWAVGQIAWTLIFGHPVLLNAGSGAVSFSDTNSKLSSTMSKIKKENDDAKLQTYVDFKLRDNRSALSKLSDVDKDSIRDFFRASLAVDPEERKTAAELLETPFMRLLKNQDEVAEGRKLLEKLGVVPSGPGLGV